MEKDDSPLPGGALRLMESCGHGSEREIGSIPTWAAREFANSDVDDV